MKRAFSFVDCRDSGGWRVRTVNSYAGHETGLDWCSTIIPDENWIGPVEAGQLVKVARAKKGRSMFKAWWADQ